MKCRVIGGVVLVVVLTALVPSLALGAEDGAALYKRRCAGCHGASGDGNTARKTPAVKGTTLTAEQIIELTTKGISTSKAPHAKGMSGVSDAQAQAIAEFVKALK